MHAYDEEAKDRGVENLLAKMSKADIFEELEEFKRYRKYEAIPATKKAELMEMIKIGINPENIKIEQLQARLKNPKLSPEEQEELQKQLDEATNK